MSYNHLTIAEREVISQMVFAGHPQKEIAQKLSRSAGTISREIKRNRSASGYSPTSAQQAAQSRRRVRPLVRKLDDPALRSWVTTGLVKLWSPDQIAGQLKLDTSATKPPLVSRQTIYRWLSGGSSEIRHLRGFLRLGRYRPRHQAARGSLIPNRRPMSDRPPEAGSKERTGDWEGDTIVGANHRGAIVTLVERRTGFLIAGKMPDGKSISLNRAVQRVFGGVPQEYRKTLTLDNGVEFARHEALERSLGITIYFARPYHSNSRAINENTNGLLRQYFPKGTDITTLSHQEVARAVLAINNRPRKRLNYRTPSDVFPSAAIALQT